MTRTAIFFSILLASITLATSPATAQPAPYPPPPPPTRHPHPGARPAPPPPPYPRYPRRAPRPYPPPPPPYPRRAPAPYPPPPPPGYPQRAPEPAPYPPDADAEPATDPYESADAEPYAPEPGDEPTFAPARSIADTRPARPPHPGYEPVRYAAAIAAVDAAAVGLALYAIDHGDRYYWMAGGAYLAAPLVHFVAGDSERGVAGVGARVGLPLGGGLLGAAAGVIIYGIGTAGVPGTTEDDTATNDEEEYTLGQFALGGLIVGAAIGVVSGGAISYYRERTRPEDAQIARASRWTPVVAPSKAGVSLGVAGRW